VWYAGAKKRKTSNVAIFIRKSNVQEIKVYVPTEKDYSTKKTSIQRDRLTEKVKGKKERTKERKKERMKERERE
jgi:hypothetical protein